VIFLRSECFPKKLFRNKKGKLGFSFSWFQSGVDNLDSRVGIFAADPDSFSVFRPLFHPIICTVHLASPETRQPDPDFSDSDHLMCEDLPDVDFVSVSVSRCLSGHPFVSTMSKDKFSEIEKLMRLVFKNAALSVDGEGLTGIYYPLAALPKEVERQLAR
jgi:hypothetical protein